MHHVSRNNEILGVGVFQKGKRFFQLWGKEKEGYKEVVFELSSYDVQKWERKGVPGKEENLGKKVQRKESKDFSFQEA